MWRLLPAFLALLPAAAPAAGWRETLEQVVPAVVVLRVSTPRAFDTGPAGTSTATGFVVDAARGLVLTNRHVVQPGPVVAEAVFQNHEEVEVAPIYRDPVHDFGFVRYDPSRVRFMPRSELRLAPDAARVGTEVRVVGNDAGEKLAILAGTLARLDREAPLYGAGRYNDFNTFYYQAASNTSGGSSGSPVVNRRGEVVALNAGGASRAASSFYLPLGRVVRALELLRRGETVTRGTLLATFEYTPYDELARLGLRPETEARVRRERPGAIGMLTVRDTVPGGPSHGVLQPGDVLVGLEGSLPAGFEELEDVLDARVGGEIGLEVERGGTPLALRLRVADLHGVTPDEYLEVGGAVLHDLSYQQARSFAVPLEGVYVAWPGYMLQRSEIPRHAVLTAVDGTPTPDLDALEAALAGRPDRARVAVRYFRLEEPHVERFALLTLDRRWHPMQRCRRDDGSGRWPCRTLPPGPPPDPPVAASTHFPETGDAVARRLARSLVLVEFHVPYRIDGVQGDRFLGAGLVVDAERGLVVTDRDTVPVSLGDATLTFAGSVEVPARSVYLHPGHNLSVLAYDPALLGETPVRTAELEPRALAPGDEVHLVALTPSQQLVAETTRVSRVEMPSIPLPSPPRFRETNVELVTITSTTPNVGGVLADGKGRVLALWASFSSQEQRGPGSFLAGLPSEVAAEVVAPLASGRDPGWRSPDAELELLTLADARSRGLPDEAARRLETHDPGRRRVLAVRRVVAGTEAARRLRVGDLVLGVNGVPVTRPRELERAVQRGVPRLALLREGRELELELPTSPLDGRGTERALVFAGALLQAPHRPLAAQWGIPLEGVYVAWSWLGSPAHRYGLRGTHRIVAVDGFPTPDLDALVSRVRGRADRDPVRLETADLEGRVSVLTLKLDLQHWSQLELRRTGAGWERVPGDAVAAAPPGVPTAAGRASRTDPEEAPATRRPEPRGAPSARRTREAPRRAPAPRRSSGGRSGDRAPGRRLRRAPPRRCAPRRTRTPDSRSRPDRPAPSSPPSPPSPPSPAPCGARELAFRSGGPRAPGPPLPQESAPA